LIIVIPPALEIFKARMLPKSNKEQIYIWIDAPRNWNIYYTNQVAQDMAKFLNCFYDTKVKPQYCKDIYKQINISKEEVKQLSIIS
jgi:multidrug efflux pump subunit AcrB